MKISLGTTYYNNPNNILNFVKTHQDYVDELIIVDDGSSNSYHIYNYIQPTEKVKIFRVKNDYGFNSHGCRNLIMTKANNDFVILLDSDRQFVDPKSTIDKIKQKKLRYNLLYRFTAHVLECGNRTHTSVNDFLISKNLFFSAGGYDEEWIGFRDGDRQYFEQLKHFGDEQILSDIHMLLTRYPSKFENDPKIISDRDIKNIPKTKYDIVMNRIEIPNPTKKILTFEWEEITCK